MNTGIFLLHLEQNYYTMKNNIFGRFLLGEKASYGQKYGEKGSRREYLVGQKRGIKLVEKVLQNVIFDLWEVMRYLPGSILGGSFLFFVYGWMQSKRQTESKIGWKGRGVRLIFAVYLVQVAMITFFSREPGSRSGIDWRLFETWGGSPQSQAFVIENILLFLPLGGLLAVMGRAFRNMGVCILTGFLLSCGIELMQLVTGRGYCQLDDVVMNVIGTAIGAAVMRRWKALRHGVFENRTRSH